MAKLCLFVKILGAVALTFALVNANVVRAELTTDAHTVGLWHLNDGGGTAVIDASGNGNHGTLIGAAMPSWVEGVFDAGLHFDCCYNTYAGQCGAAAFPAGMLNLANATLEMYISYDYQTSGPNPADTAFVGYLFYDGVNNFARINIDTTDPHRWYGKVTYGVHTGGGWLEIRTPHEFALDADVWTHIAFTRSWDGAKTQTCIYINGAAVANGTISSSPTLGGGAAYIGHTGNNNVSFGGEIDEVRLSNIARSEFGFSAPQDCGNWGHLPGDINHDCYVDLIDFAAMAEEWLECIPLLGGDLDHDGCVEIDDFADLAGHWNGCTDPCNPADCDMAYDSLLRFENALYACELAVGSGANDALGLTCRRLFNKELSVDYLSAGNDGALFMVFGDGFAVDSGDFAVDAVSEARQGDADVWQINMSYPDRQLQAVLTVTVDDSDQMQWALAVENTAATPQMLQPVFPLIGALDIGGDLTDNYYFYPWRSGLVGNVDCDLRCEYGNLGWMQVVSVFNRALDAGLYCYPQDSSGLFKGMPFRKMYGLGTPTVEHSEIVAHREEPHTGDPTQPVDVLAGLTEGIAFAYYYPRVEIDSGQEYVLPETVVSLYQGGWKEALSDYSQWAHTWYSHVDTPQWFKNCFNSVGAWPPYYYSDAKGRYIRSESMHDPDPMHLEQWAHWHDYEERPEVPLEHGMEKFQPGDFEYHQARGGLTAFRDEIQAVQQKKTRVTVYVNDKMCWQGTDTGLAYGQDWAAMDVPGRYTTWGGPNEKWVECLYEPNAWPAYITETCGRIIRDTGMDGIYLDEMPLMFPCYNPDHVHYQEDAYPFSTERMVQYITSARAAIRAENPEGILMTEHAGSDYFTQLYDGSWTQTFYQPPFTFAEEYYDENSLNYFRFCFPEFKLLEWGPSENWERRSFFNGVGICTYPITGQLELSGQVLKENGDAFASLNPEPLIPTRIANGLLANKFPIAEKCIYTVYNKNQSGFEGTALLEVERHSGYHYVELFYDDNLTAVNPVGDNDELVFGIDGETVLCIAQLPEIIQTSQNGDTLDISLAQYDGSETLVAFLNYDNSFHGFEDGEIIALTAGQGQLLLPDWLGNGKVILKLFDGELLLDEVVIGERTAVGQGTIALWHLDEGTGDFAQDAVGNDHNLVLGSEYYWSSGAPATGSPHSLGTPYSCDTYCSSWIHPDDITDQVSVSAWIRAANVDPDGSYIVTMANKFMLRINSGKTSVSFIVRTDDAVWEEVWVQPLGEGVVITNGNWYHLAGVYDGRQDASGNANLYLYWNGVLKATHSFPVGPEGQLMMSGGSGKVYLGAANNVNTTQNYMGSIDEVEISNTVVTF